MLAATTSAFPQVTQQAAVSVAEMPADQPFFLPTDSQTLLCLVVRDGRPVIHEGCCACVVIDTSSPPFRTNVPKGQIRLVACSERAIRVDQVQRALYAVSCR